MKKTILFLIGILAVLFVFSAGAGDAITDLFTRPPAVTIPKMTGFAIDGVFSAEEERYTAMMNGFCLLDSMRIFDPEACFQVGTDGKNLYIGIRCETGPQGILTRTAKGYNTKVFMDDCFEFVISPDPDAAMPDLFHIIVNNRGAYMTQSRQNTANCAWAPEFEAVGSVENNIWTYEIAFPLAQFGITQWQEGESIGLRICRNWKRLSTSDFGQSSWSQIRGTFFDSGNIPRVTLRNGAPVVRFLSLRNESGADLKVGIFNPDGKPRELKLQYFHQPINSQSINLEDRLRLAPGESKVINLPVAQITPEESVQTAFRVSDGNNEPLWQRAFVWKPDKHPVFADSASDVLNMLCPKFAYYAESDRMFIHIDSGALKDAETITPLKATVTDANGVTVAETELPGFRNHISEYLWQLPSLREYTRNTNPSGTYELTFTIGKEKITRKFERKLFDWEGNSLGQSDILLPPFTPLNVENNIVSSILRRHTLNSCGLWEQVEAEGKNLLTAGGMKLRAEINGKTFDAEGRGVSFTRISDTCVSGRAEWSAGPLTGSTDFAFDFDGMMKFDLKINPGCPIESLKLIIPLDAKYSGLLHACTDGLRFNYGGKTPDRWNSAQAARNDLVTSFVPYLWLGTETAGFSVFAENDRDWTVSDSIPTQTIERKDGQTEVVLNLISVPDKLERPRTITMAFQATPVKPMRKNWRKYQASWGLDGRIAPYCDYRICLYPSSWTEGGVSGFDDLLPRDNDFGVWEAFAQVRQTREIPEGFLDRWTAGYRDNEAKEKGWYRAEVEHGLYLARDTAMPGNVTFYTNARGQRLDLPESKTFLDNWFRGEFQDTRDTEPAYGASQPYGVDPTASYRDYAVSCYREMLDSGACDNLYWDDVFLASDFDRSGSEPTYLTPNGRLQPSTGLFNIRALIKRGAVLQMEMNRIPNNMVHMTNTAMAPICAFAQQNLDWEDNNGTNPFQQRYTKEYIRAVSLGRQFGNLPAAIGLVNTSCDPEAVKWCFRTGAGVAITHEIQWARGGESNDYNNVLLEFYKFGYGDDDLVKVWNYWDDDYPVKITGGDNASILLVKGDEAYLVVSSYCDDAVFHVSVAGFQDASAVNAETGETIARDGGDMVFKLKKYDFIFIKMRK